MTLPIKTYWASMAHAVYEMSKFIVKHRATMLAVVGIVSPTDAAAVDAAFTSILTFAALFERIHHIIDPNAAPTE